MAEHTHYRDHDGRCIYDGCGDVDESRGRRWPATDANIAVARGVVAMAGGNADDEVRDLAAQSTIGERNQLTARQVMALSLAEIAGVPTPEPLRDHLVNVLIADLGYHGFKITREAESVTA